MQKLRAGADVTVHAVRRGVKPRSLLALGRQRSPASASAAGRRPHPPCPPACAAMASCPTCSSTPGDVRRLGATAHGGNTHRLPARRGPHHRQPVHACEAHVGATAAIASWLHCCLAAAAHGLAAAKRTQKKPGLLPCSNHQPVQARRQVRARTACHRLSVAAARQPEPFTRAISKACSRLQLQHPGLNSAPSGPSSRQVVQKVHRCGGLPTPAHLAALWLQPQLRSRIRGSSLPACLPSHSAACPLRSTDVDPEVAGSTWLGWRREL